MTHIPDELLAKVEKYFPPSLPSFPFPWDGLEEYMTRSQENTLPLIGYGSLLNSASAARTLKHVDTDRSPCVAFGIRRVFNYEYRKAALARYLIPEWSRERAALNAIATGNVRDKINAMLITIRSSDIPALKEREFGYDLIPALHVPWDPVEFEAPEVAYILCAPDLAANPEYQVVNPDIDPVPAYAETCEEGAAEHSPEFHHAYLSSTYLADKVTLWKQ